MDSKQFGNSQHQDKFIDDEAGAAGVGKEGIFSGSSEAQVGDSAEKEGFSDDDTKYYFKDLVFTVHISARRKKSAIVFNRANCEFELKLNKLEFFMRTPEFLKRLKRMVTNSYPKLKQLLQDNVKFKDFNLNKSDALQYNTDDIVYLNGMPYRLEIEYEMHPDLSKPSISSLHNDAGDTMEIKQEPQQLALMMVPQENSRYGGKFEYLYEHGYYNKNLLQELPILITQAAAERYNADLAAAKQAITDFKSRTGATSTSSATTTSSTTTSSGAATISSASTSSSTCATSTANAAQDSTTSSVSTSSKASAANEAQASLLEGGNTLAKAAQANAQVYTQDKAIQASGRGNAQAQGQGNNDPIIQYYVYRDVLRALPVQAGLILPPRHMQLLMALYLKRAPLDYAWMFSLDQDSPEFRELEAQYGRAIKSLTTELYFDLWRSLNVGEVCLNKFLLDADGQFLKRVLYSPVHTPVKYWLFDRAAHVAHTLSLPKGTRFTSKDSIWLYDRIWACYKCAKKSSRLSDYLTYVSNYVVTQYALGDEKFYKTSSLSMVTPPREKDRELYQKYSKEQNFSRFLTVAQASGPDLEIDMPSDQAQTQPQAQTQVQSHGALDNSWVGTGNSSNSSDGYKSGHDLPSQHSEHSGAGAETGNEAKTKTKAEAKAKTKSEVEEGTGSSPKSNHLDTFTGWNTLDDLEGSQHLKMSDGMVLVCERALGQQLCAQHAAEGATVSNNTHTEKQAGTTHEHQILWWQYGLNVAMDYNPEDDDDYYDDGEWFESLGEDGGFIAGPHGSSTVTPVSESSGDLSLASSGAGSALHGSASQHAVLQGKVANAQQDGSLQDRSLQEANLHGATLQDWNVSSRHGKLGNYPECEFSLYRGEGLYDKLDCSQFYDIEGMLLCAEVDSLGYRNQLLFPGDNNGYWKYVSPAACVTLSRDSVFNEVADDMGMPSLVTLDPVPFVPDDLGDDYLAVMFHLFAPRDAQVILKALDFSDEYNDGIECLSPERSLDNHWEMRGVLQQRLKEHKEQALLYRNLGQFSQWQRLTEALIDNLELNDVLPRTAALRGYVIRDYMKEQYLKDFWTFGELKSLENQQGKLTWWPQCKGKVDKHYAHPGQTLGLSLLRQYARTLPYAVPVLNLFFDPYQDRKFIVEERFLATYLVMQELNGKRQNAKLASDFSLKAQQESADVSSGNAQNAPDLSQPLFQAQAQAQAHDQNQAQAQAQAYDQTQNQVKSSDQNQVQAGAQSHTPVTYPVMSDIDLSLAAHSFKDNPQPQTITQVVKTDMAQAQAMAVTEIQNELQVSAGTQVNAGARACSMAESEAQIVAQAGGKDGDTSGLCGDKAGYDKVASIDQSSNDDDGDARFNEPVTQDKSSVEFKEMLQCTTGIAPREAVLLSGFAPKSQEEREARLKNSRKLRHRPHYDHEKDHALGKMRQRPDADMLSLVNAAWSQTRVDNDYDRYFYSPDLRYANELGFSDKLSFWQPSEEVCESHRYKDQEQTKSMNKAHLFLDWSQERRGGTYYDQRNVEECQQRSTQAVRLGRAGLQFALERELYDDTLESLPDLLLQQFGLDHSRQLKAYVNKPVVDVVIDPLSDTYKEFCQKHSEDELALLDDPLDVLKEETAIHGIGVAASLAKPHAIKVKPQTKGASGAKAQSLSQAQAQSQAQGIWSQAQAKGKTIQPQAWEQGKRALPGTSVAAYTKAEKAMLVNKAIAQLTGQSTSRTLTQLELHGDKLLPGMCWTLCAEGQEIDPAEAAIAVPDIFFNDEMDFTPERYFEATGYPVMDAELSRNEPMLAWDVACMFRENERFEHASWQAKCWRRTLVRPGIIKLKIAYRAFKELDSDKERQYRFNVLMYFGRELLLKQVLRAVQLLTPTLMTHGVKTNDYMHLSELLLEPNLLQADNKYYCSLQALFFYAFQSYFNRCLVTAGMSAQGRCSVHYGRPNTYTLSVAQEMVAYPLSYVLATVMHEVTHLKEFNHSVEFKYLLNTLCPFYGLVDKNWLEIKSLRMTSPLTLRLSKSIDVSSVLSDANPLPNQRYERYQFGVFDSASLWNLDEMSSLVPECFYD